MRTLLELNITIDFSKFRRLVGETRRTALLSPFGNIQLAYRPIRQMSTVVNAVSERGHRKVTTHAHESHLSQRKSYQFSRPIRSRGPVAESGENDRKQF